MSDSIVIAEDFIISNNEYGWIIKHKESDKSRGINYTAIPRDASVDYVRGYAKCLAYQEGWIKP